MRKIALLLYNAWCIFWFVGIFLLLYPFMWVCIQRKKWHPRGHRLFQLWADIYFPLIAKPIEIEFRYTPSKENVYVFVANHFSYLDIALGMGVIKNYFAFVGKSSVAKIPLFGYAFRKLHIAVDRSDKNSRSKTMLRGIKTLAAGKSIFIMPEGGIVSQAIPTMHSPFKDGPFIMALENKVPIVPITFENNYKLMPKSTLYFGRPKVVIHEPIYTTNLNKLHVPELKEQVYTIIQTELDKTTSNES